MTEIWKDIKGYNGYYQVSNLGRVRSMDREVIYSDGTIHHHKGRLIKSGRNEQGYLQVHLQKQREQKTYGVHRLVALHFVDGYAEGLQVNHKDENKQNNRADNLEWCTPLYNVTYGNNYKRRIETYKKDSYTKRGKLLEVYKDGELVGVFNGYKEAGEALGYTLEYMSMLANGQRISDQIKVIIKRPRSYQIAQFFGGELVATYPSITSASKAVKGDRMRIKNAIENNKVYHGFTWRKI